MKRLLTVLMLSLVLVGTAVAESAPWYLVRQGGGKQTVMDTFTTLTECQKGKERADEIIRNSQLYLLTVACIRGTNN